ncbi:MAG TPA: UDP-3-O-[3-hydroxymyristoyl] N-acetylglucosamine deacetylase [Gammaproteobacteria bacterium]|nr:UDP-3-O-acyl-N-acetylglucosamine deacetylase [Litorivicinus sp.]MDA8631892.1 UDP-3-O-acyl-N-acetylglucosamine deacetylase [Litorivicinaceae bacterium]NBR74862.1 UDP-3-O-acyl-N-acetylglucosamine deacetylase [Gammaproteobacteria bacterium]MDA9006258.1 UDP-3-O-acyl-N-acetylglucosamine deacetylase [Litorivicinus sp.]MDB2412276.1 UDP-3-O-acyl-N-acetylglucosamine deacetylase [Litorivicinaceae bacterium]
MIAQRTLKNVVRATGVGLHSGDTVYLTLRPAPENHGIQFKRVDLDPPVLIRANADSVSQTTLSTCLSSPDGVQVSTVEHLLSALSGMGIDNALVECNAPELPIMDGSASPFVFLIQSAGVREQTAPREYIRITHIVEVEHEGKVARLEPFNGFRISFSIDFDHPVVDQGECKTVVDIDEASFVREVSRARTFGFMRDLDYLKANNLARGGSMANAIVVGEDRILNDDGLRQNDEFVKHKVLDALGDLYLAGRPIIGHYSGNRSGHALNNKLLRQLFLDPTNYEVVTFDRVEDCPIPVQPIAETDV